MPKGNVQWNGFVSRGGGSGSAIRPEEGLGIAVLVLILVALLIIGCWYYKKRSGYKILRSRHPNNGVQNRFVMSRNHSEEGVPLDPKVPLNEYTTLNPVVPNAPPAYEKICSEPLPPPYSP
ncbi:melanoma antigen recognized by T-cells 1 [Latimeria chalumnae]|uniref:melanoma antigen recognized by T-cells 1 n=1 Tax=Latimeria chalumnae TaxID=7897 RepID=UPI0003C11A12|nr:PREDICTED: melanoma antigen recognized by T-cells 1 [Latimeria chalumnae]|eukprot:XP_006004698.1 PREDICTED: melanoma antigen recognized by T-cells 1 [Latimeria chalumnae]